MTALSLILGLSVLTHAKSVYEVQIVLLTLGALGILFEVVKLL